MSLTSQAELEGNDYSFDEKCCDICPTGCTMDCYSGMQGRILGYNVSNVIYPENYYQK